MLSPEEALPCWAGRHASNRLRVNPKLLNPKSLNPKPLNRLALGFWADLCSFLTEKHGPPVSSDRWSCTGEEVLVKGP